MTSPPRPARVISAARARRRRAVNAAKRDEHVDPAALVEEHDPALVDARTLERSLRGVIASLQRTLESVHPVLTPVQLWCLRELEAGGSASVSDLAGAIGVVPSTVSRNGDRLIAAGLVSRKAIHGDRRQVALKLTSAGARVLAQTCEARARAIYATVAHMDSADRAALLRGAEAFAATRAARDQRGRA